MAQPLPQSLPHPLERRVAYLESALRMAEGDQLAEADGTMAARMNKPREENPYDRAAQPTLWLNWNVGWDNYHYRWHLKEVVECARGVCADAEVEADSVVRLRAAIQKLDTYACEDVREGVTARR